MPRALTPSNTITLPKLTAREAHTLAQALISVATAKDAHKKPVHKLTEAIQAALDEVVDALKALVAIAHLPGDEPEVRKVDLRIDRVVSALHQILSGWEKLEEELAEGKTAAGLNDQLFATGLDFTQIAPREEWAAIEQRLVAVKRDGLEPKLDSLGLKPVVGLLRTVQVEYGRVTGATSETTEKETPQVNEHRLALIEAIREYAVAVLGSVIRKKPETKEQADALLAPITQWASRPQQKRTDGKKDGEEKAPPAQDTKPE